MKFAPHSLIPALLGLALMPLSPARAEEEHHQPDSATAAPSATTPAEQPVAAASMPMMNMMNMMGQAQGMPMMNMMGQGGMGMTGMMGQGAMPGTMPMAGMPMQGMGAHLEGRIAFLRAELAITESQVPQWEAFAQALRDSTAKMKQAQVAAPQAAAATFLQRAEIQEQWLSARLDGLKEIKTAYVELQAVLSEDQKKTAEALLTQPVCLGQMGMM